MSTVVGPAPSLPAPSVAANLVLNAFRSVGAAARQRRRPRLWRDDERVERLEVQRVGDVDDDLAGELVGRSARTSATAG